MNNTFWKVLADLYIMNTTVLKGSVRFINPPHHVLKGSGRSINHEHHVLKGSGRYINHE